MVEIREMYLNAFDGDEKKLASLCFNEMESSQYEEATAHFDQLVLNNPDDYMTYFFRAYCKSHCGVRGNVVPDSQTLTSAFSSTCEKALESKEGAEIKLEYIINLYVDAMDNLASNAVEEVTVDSKGNTHHSNPDKIQILRDKKNAVYSFTQANFESISNQPLLKSCLVIKLKSWFEVDIGRYRDYGALVAKLDPSYSDTYTKKIANYDKKQKIKFIVIIVILAIVVIASLIS